MTIIKKLVTLLRGSARELGQSVVDGNATRIYEQEIIDAKHSITEAKAELTTVMAKEMREHEREIGIAKTTESVYRATQSISDSIGATGSNLVSARESLERIKKRHEDLADRMAAAEQLDQEFGHKALERKLAEAGIGHSDKARAADVMARIKARRAEGAAPAAPAAPAAGDSTGAAA
jgi:phage shock protein A